MIDFFLKLFDPSEAPTSTRGGALSTTTGWFHLSSDMAIFFAYAVLCALLMIFLYRQRRLPHRRTIWLIWLFMLACGITRLVGATMLYYPAFRLLLVVKVITAIISLITVFAVARAFPAMLDFEAFANLNRKSREDTEQQRRARDDALTQRDKLEQRASQLTVRDRRVRRALVGSAAAACGWDATSNEIVWEVGLKDLFGMSHDDSEPARSWTQFLSEADCGRITAASRSVSASGGELVLELPLSRADGREGVLVIRARMESGGGGGANPRPIIAGLVSFVPAGVAA